MTDWIGRVLDGRYVIEAVLGGGGMGMVFRARHQFTGATVAIKLLRPELEIDPAIQNRFLAEARAPNAIGHPGIVKVLDAGKAANGPLYLVMELLAGTSLRTPMSQRSFTAHDVRRIALELTSALAAAHARGFVHRDLKPENIFLCTDGTIKLLDFGIAKVLDHQGAARTATGVIMGSPAYMAPEQLEDAASVDARADIWATAIIVFEMVSGQRPLGGRTIPEQLAALSADAPVTLRQVAPSASPALELILSRALAKDRSHRYRSIDELARALSALPVEALTPIWASTPQQPVPPTVAPDQPTYGAPVPRDQPTYATPAPASPTPASPPVSPAPTPVSADRGGADRHDRGGADRGGAAKSRGALWVAIAVLIGGAITVAVVMAKRKTAKVVDAAVVALDASVDAAVDAPVDAMTVDAIVRPTEPCEAACFDAHACGIARKTCVDDCHADPRLRKCLELAASDCGESALCGWRLVCGKEPSGKDTCAAAATCQNANCQPTDDFTCGCKCAMKAARSESLELLRLDVCTIDCNFDSTCIGLECSEAITYCFAAPKM